MTLFVLIGNGRGKSRRRSHKHVFFLKEKRNKMLQIRSLLSKDRRQWRQNNVAFMFALFKCYLCRIRVASPRCSKRQARLSFCKAHLGHFILLKKRFYEGDKRTLKFDDPKEAEALPQNLEKISRSNDVA